MRRDGESCLGIMSHALKFDMHILAGNLFKSLSAAFGGLDLLGLDGFDLIDLAGKLPLGMTGIPMIIVSLPSSRLQQVWPYDSYHADRDRDIDRDWIMQCLGVVVALF